jgi:hypothetical protein
MCSSTIGTILIGHPSVVTSNWKPTAYTRFGCIRDYDRWCGGAAVAIAPAALWHSKPLFAPKALHLLVIDCPALCTGVVIRGPKWRIRIVGLAVTGSWRWVA